MTGRRSIAAVAVAWLAGCWLGSLAAPAASALPSIVIGRARAGFFPDVDGKRTISILVVGSDARPGGNVMRSRADSLHVVLIRPRKHRAVVVGIPRDSWVPIAGGGSNKINAALASGGPDRLVATIRSSFGVPIDYWAVTGFAGLKRMVNDVGGIDVHFPFRLGAGRSFAPGRHHVRGSGLLALARDRHGLRSGDFGRQENGGRLLIATLEEFQSDVHDDPDRLLVWLGAALRTLDTDVAARDLIDLAFLGLRLPARRIQNVVLPGGTGTVGSSSVVFLSRSRAVQIFRDAADGRLRRANVPRSPTAGQ